ncbi:MAG TPA: C1 family peptidase [Candidatus Coprenecus merdipullorum]|nr:C1 family peptidase [Candidatus Coprenecus merdipullorum]
MRLNLIIAGALVLATVIPSQAGTRKKQQEPEWVNPYQFTEVVRIPVTSVKNQNASGTCWCFATTSFLEAELLREGKGEYDLSEMFTVRYNYYERLNDNYLRRGKGNIGEGSIAHMALKVIDKYGIVPQSAYLGINYDSPLPDHRELGTYIAAIAGASVELRQRSPEYFELQDALFDIYMGKIPENFEYEGKEYTPISFRDMLGIDIDDYVEITSFSHHPFYQEVPLEIPDNWDHELLYNLPLDDMMAVIDNALNNGYTVCWDGDVSEQGYVFMPTGVAVLPADPRTDMQTIAASGSIIEEVEYVDQAMRQAGFESFTTTDDHLEHITGIATDPAGTRYYITKNSWGERGPFDGYHYMSEKYVRAKTVSILVHKDAIPSDIKAKMGL